ncbi:MAG: Fibronectin type domain protein [Deltaproteobacteria bacterium]|nr:Fibronectin type domain protein [Deltaproteobacteria bacterium]
MLKRNISVFKIICLAVLSVALASSMACGKKGPPVPIAVVRAGVITDLKAEEKDGVIFLSFTPPARIEPAKKDDKGSVEVTAFKVVKGCGTCLADLQPFRTIVLEEKKGYTIAGNRLYLYDDDVMDKSEYAYRIYPVTVRGTQGEASNTAVITWKQPPGPPGPLKVEEADSRIEISWPKQEGYLYNVYRWDNGLYPVMPLNPRPIPTPLYMDGALTNGKTYTYEVRQVRASDPGVEGEGSKIDATPKDTTPPAPPMLVKAEKKGNAIMITWEAGTEKDLAGYNVYRIMGSKPVKVNTSPVKENKYTDTHAPDFRFIAYHVTAVDTAGNESGPSQEAIVMLKE